MSTVTPFGATSLHDAIAKMAERVGTREGRRRAVVVFTDGQDNASRLTPSEVSGIASSIDVPVYLFAAVPSIDNPSTEFSTGEGRFSLDGSAERPRGLDRRPRIRGQHAGRTQRGRAANRRRAASSISHRFRIERQVGLASARGPCAEQGPHSAGPERIYGRAISPDFGLGGSIMLRKFFIAVPLTVLVIGGTTACATKKFVRTSVGEVNTKVDSLGRSVEETQERTRQNEGRIAEVDQKAQAAAQAASRPIRRHSRPIRRRPRRKPPRTRSARRPMPSTRPTAG